MNIKDVDPDTLKDWMDQDKAVLIDVREADEYAAENIAAAHHVPLSAFQGAAFPDHDGRIVVYHCRSGARTFRFGPALTMAVPRAADVYHLAGGIIAWRNAGYATRNGGNGNGGASA